MKKQVLTFVFAILNFTIAFAQHGELPTKRVCGTMQHHEYLKQTRPNYEAELTQYNQMIEQYLQTRAAEMATGKSMAMPTVTIPVVVHVVYQNATENISDAQAASQVQVLNDDFAKLNTDAYKVTQPTFSTVAAGANIRFCLAQRDPSGNPTTGIVHKSTTVATFSTNDAVKNNASGGDSPWDVTKYVNVWICDLGTSLLGYGEFPTGTISNTWGLVINYRYAGSGGTAQAPFNLGRTGTHEFGHCFNLYHIWGDEANCTGSDQCADTPNQGAEHYGCFAQGSIQTDACSPASPGTMWMNYMDYTDDACMYMFTQNQVARMEAVVNTAPWNVLQSSNACVPPISVDASLASILNPLDGSSTCNNAVTPQITLSNSGANTLTSSTILYRMDATATQTLNWTGTLATGASTVLTLNNYTGLTASAHTFSAWITQANGAADTYTPNNAKASTYTVATAPVGQALPFTEGFESGVTPPAGWVIQKANTVDAAASWSVVANTTGLTAGSTRIARMDNYSSGSNMTGQLDALRTPALTFTAANTSLSLSFDVSHRYYGGQYADTLNVYISSDCGGSWTKLFTKGGTQLTSAGTGTAAYTPTANAQWRRETVSLSSYAGLSSVYLKFENRSGWGNYLYLDNVNITYTPTASAPVANFSTSVTSACTSSSVQLTDMSTNTPTSWSWSVTPAAAISNTATQNPSITFSSAGTYSITLTATNGAGSGNTTKTITVVSTPTVAASNATLCSGSSTTLSASGATTYTWMPGSLTTASIVVSPTAATIYTVTGANGSCTNTRTVSVSINTTPTVTVNSPSICAGSNATLTATGATSYSWSTGASTASISVSPTLTTNYTVTGTTSSCSSVRVATVTVNSLPTVNATTSGTITCTASTVNVIASGASSYTWAGTGITAGANSATATINAGGSFTVTGSSSAGCTNTAVTTVIQNTATPNISVSPNTSICVGASTVLNVSSSTSPVTYSWTTGATTTSISVSPTLTTAYTATVTNTSNGCKATGTTTVTVNSLPNVTVSSATICSGSTGTLTASGASTYTWNTGATTAAIAVSPTVATNYTVTGTSAAGCVRTATASVSVGSAPSIAVNSATICSGASATLTASGVNTYTWSTGSNSPSIIVNPTSLTVYTVTGNLTGCGTTASNTATVTVISNPTVTASSATICNGSTANLTASGATSYSWSTGATTSTVAVSPTGTTNYTVTGTTSGCSSSAVGSVSVVANPTVSVNSPSICSGSTATLTASGATSYSWSTGSTATSIVASPTLTTNYTVTGTTSGCSSVRVATVTVNTLPTVNASNTGTITCSAPTVNVIGSGASSYTWTGTGITAGVNSATATVNASGTFTVTGASAAGCVNSAVTTVVANTTVPTLTVSPSASICAGSSANISAMSSSSPVAYTWNTGATTQTITVTPTITTVYTATVTNTSNGCMTNGSTTISVNGLPTVSVNSPTICSGSSATLTATGANTYSWSTSATGTSIIVNPTINTSYTVTGTSAAGCTNSVVSNVVVTSAPAITVNSATVCAGNTATLTASGVTTYTWNTGSNATSISVSPASTTVYTITGTLSGCGANVSNTATVVVNALPTASLDAISGPLCVNSSVVNLNGSPSGGVYTGSGVSGSTFDPAVSGAGTFTINYLYTDANTCSASASQTVDVSLCTGVTELNDNTISVYPNPTRDLLTIKLDESYVGNTTLEVFDAIGKLVIEEQVNSDIITTLSLRQFAKGMYTVRIVSTKHNPSVVRIIKE